MSSSSNPNPLTGKEKAQKEQRQSFFQWAKDTYNDQYEKWMPWIEDQYLKWFGKGDNKASYATKGKLSSSTWIICAKANTMST